MKKKGQKKKPYMPRANFGVNIHTAVFKDRTKTIPRKRKHKSREE